MKSKHKKTSKSKMVFLPGKTVKQAWSDEDKLTYCKVLKTSFDVKEPNITCTLNCKINLKEFERQKMHFTENFVKDTLSKWLPTIKTIYNYDVIENPVVAEFYILPGENKKDKTVKVLQFNRDYYAGCRKYAENKLLNVGDIINYDDMPGVNESKNEISSIDYCETFKVKGVAKCSADETFDKEKGTKLAEHKAKESLMRHCWYMINDIKGLLESITVGIHLNQRYLEDEAVRLDERYKEF